MTKAVARRVTPVETEPRRSWRRRRRYDRAMNTLMIAALPATARPAFSSTTTDDPDLTSAGLTPVDAARIGEALAAARTDGTRRLYDVVWGQWQRWCAQRGVTAVPAAPLTVCAYLTERAEAGRATGTLDMACTVIRHVHRTTGAVDPIAPEAVRQVRRGLRRTYGAAPRRLARPLSVEESRQIVSGIDRTTPHGIRDAAIILLGYASAMRPGEISALDVEDVITKPTGILISVRRSKTDQDAHGQLVGVARGDNPLTDPIRALDAWLKIRPTARGALFTRVVYPGSLTTVRIGPRAVSRLVQQRANAAGFDGIPVTGHSLRAGHATTAAVNGASIDRIAAQARAVSTSPRLPMAKRSICRKVSRRSTRKRASRLDA